MDQDTLELQEFLKDLSGFLDLPLTGTNMASAQIMLMAIGISALLGLVTKSKPLMVSFIGSMAGFFYKKLNREGRSERSKQVRGLITFILFTFASYFITLNLYLLIPETGLPLNSWFNALILGLCLTTSHSWFLGRKAVFDLDDEGLRKSEAPFYSKLTKDMIDIKDPFQMGRVVVQFQAISIFKYLITPLLIYRLLGLEFVVVYTAITALDFSASFSNKASKNFGFLASKIDWLINFIPARIAMFLTYMIALLLPFTSEKGTREALSNNPNKWENSAVMMASFAGALKITLSGPAIQNDVSTNKPWQGPKDAPARVSLKKIAESSALNLYCTILILLFWFGLNFSI